MDQEESQEFYFPGKTANENPLEERGKKKKKPRVERGACKTEGGTADKRVGAEGFSLEVSGSVDRVAPDQPGGWLQTGTLSSTFSAERACQASQGRGLTFPLPAQDPHGQGSV